PTHDVLQRAMRFCRVRTIHAFLVGGLADASDRRQGPVEGADDVSEGDLRRRLEEGIAALGSSSALDQARMLQTQEDVLEKDHRNVLAISDLLPRGRTAVVPGELDQRPEAVFAFLRELHA